MRGYPHRDLALNVLSYVDSHRSRTDLVVNYIKISVAGGFFCLLEYSLDVLE